MPYKHLFRRPYIYFLWFAVCAAVCICALYYRDAHAGGGTGLAQLSSSLFYVCGLAMPVLAIVYWADLYKYSRMKQGLTSYDMLNFISVVLTLAGFAAFLVAWMFYLMFKDGVGLTL
jgi:hypothetical protein